MKVSEVAKRLEVSPALVYSLCAVGKLKCHRIGLGRGCIRVSEEQLLAFLAGAEPITKLVVLPPPVRRIKLKHLKLN